MDKRMFVTDLDGTLLNSDMALTDYTVAVLNRLIDEEMKTYSTSRSFYTASIMLKKVRFNLPCITYNGAYIIDPRTKEIIKKNLLSINICGEIIAKSLELQLSPYIFGMADQGEEKLIYNAPSNIAQEQFLRERTARKDKRLQPKSQAMHLKEVINLSFLYPVDKISQLNKIVRDYSDIISIKIMDDIYNDGYQTLEVSNKQANKGGMLHYICNLVGVELSDVVVFGDQMNDIDMFKIAGIKVAVENATEELKKISNIIIKKNDEDGVARFLLAASSNKIHI